VRLPSPRDTQTIIFLPFRPLGGRNDCIAINDLPCQDLNFAVPATAGATPKWNLDAGTLQAIQQVLGWMESRYASGSVKA
jgi:hypothetical protein